MTILYHFYLFSALLEPGALREDGGVLGKLVVRETWPWIEAKMYLKRGGWDKLKLKWNRVTCVLKMGWHTHLLESCHWHWHATHWRATQSSNEASFHLPPPLGWPSALSLFQGHWMVMWTRSVWPALTPWILTRTSPASRSAAAGKKTSHNFHNSHHLTIETWPEPWMGMRKRQQLEFFFLSAMCSLCKWGKIKIQVSYHSKIYFYIASIRKRDERSWL